MAEDKGFTVLPNVIFDLKLNVQAQSLYIALYSFFNKEKGYAYPSYEQLKERSKLKDNRTLNKAMNCLIDLKLIRKETVIGIGNKYYLYEPSGELHHMENSTTCKITPPPSGELHHDLVENYTTTNTNINTNTNTIYSSSKDESDSKGNSEKDNNSNSNSDNKKKKNTKSEDFKFKSKDHEEAFKEIWSLYPNKKGIAKARERINKLLDRISKDELIRCVQRYKAECIKEKRENKYIQQGSTFFNGPYEDYLDCNYEEITSLSVDESVKRSKEVEF